ncbi:MAG: nicotinate (nicotinamide) nucleotide adenylyltransferase [Muribaculaceae bacterium]|nr:nicotinate (nicotinamide) nucleotide adenylyltransferase [Muribaculaceae bacterium]
MTIGLYGGSFDPIHTGHAMVANFVAQCNVVDEVWFMVSRQNPLKPNSTIANDSQRLEMATIVANKCRNVKVTDVEMHLPSPSFTINAVKELKRIYHHYNFKIIIGSDSLENFKFWKDSEQLLNDFGVIVYPRPGFPLPTEQPENMIFLNGAPEFSISSTLIREYITSDWNVNYFLPPEVAEYISRNKLYKP